MSAQPPKKSLGSVIVIGGCGFLGHHIVNQLVESYDAQVTVLDLKTDRYRNTSAEYSEVDITSKDAVETAFRKFKPRVIIHTASPAFVGDEGHNKELYRRVNVDGTENLVKCAREAGVKAFIYTSSSSVVHDNVHSLVNADERWPVLRAPQQKEYYSESKAIAELFVLDSNRKHGDMLTVSLRPAGIYGEGDLQVIPGFLKAYYGNQTKWQLGDNDNLYDFTYVGNVAYAHILAAIALLNTHSLNKEPLDHEKVDGEAFIITNGSPLYMWDFARLVWKAAGDETLPSQVWVLPRDFGLKLAYGLEWMFWLFGRKPNLSWKVVNLATMTRYFNIDKARIRLGYVPQVEMEEGVFRSVRWIQEQKQEDQKKGSKKVG